MLIPDDEMVPNGGGSDRDPVDDSVRAEDGESATRSSRSEEVHLGQPVLQPTPEDQDAALKFATNLRDSVLKLVREAERPIALTNVADAQEAYVVEGGRLDDLMHGPGGAAEQREKMARLLAQSGAFDPLKVGEGLAAQGAVMNKRLEIIPKVVSDIEQAFDAFAVARRTQDTRVEGLLSASALAKAQADRARVRIEREETGLAIYAAVDAQIVQLKADGKLRDATHESDIRLALASPVRLEEKKELAIRRVVLDIRRENNNLARQEADAHDAEIALAGREELPSVSEVRRALARLDHNNGIKLEGLKILKEARILSRAERIFEQEQLLADLTLPERLRQSALEELHRLDARGTDQAHRHHVEDRNRDIDHKADDTEIILKQRKVDRGRFFVNLRTLRVGIPVAIIAVSNLVADQPKYHNTQPFAAVNNLWDSGWHPLKNGVVNLVDSLNGDNTKAGAPVIPLPSGLTITFRTPGTAVQSAPQPAASDGLGQTLA